MDLDEIKQGLRAEIKKRENEQYSTFQTNVREMCKDVLTKLEEQESDYKEACDRLQTANIIKDEQLAATRHSKYKRCLAMASYWVAVSFQCVDDKCRSIAENRHYKWLKLAENFTEAK